MSLRKFPETHPEKWGLLLGNALWKQTITQDAHTHTEASVSHLGPLWRKGRCLN